MKKILITIILFSSFNSFAQSDRYKYQKIEADEYYQAGRYFDAFYMYRNLLKTDNFLGDFYIQDQIKNSSRALFHWRKTQDHRAYQQYEIAKDHMKNLIELNPYDPNRGLLPVLTLEMANQMKRRGIASRTQEGQADFYSKALEYYSLALDEGLKDDLVFAYIRQVEHVLKDNPYSQRVKQPTSYDIRYQKDKEERERTIKILNDIKEKEDPGLHN